MTPRCFHACANLGTGHRVHGGVEGFGLCCGESRHVLLAGSALVISNDAQLSATDEEIAPLRDMIAQTSTPHFRLCTDEEVAALFEGYRLLAPVVVPAARWRPDQPVTDAEARQANVVYGAVGILT